MRLYVARLKENGNIDYGTAGPDEDAVRAHMREIYEQLPEYEVVRFLPASEYDTLGLVARGFIERAEKERDRMAPIVEAAIDWHDGVVAVSGEPPYWKSSEIRLFNAVQTYIERTRESHV